jgi:hypothetical protein
MRESVLKIRDVLEHTRISVVSQYSQNVIRIYKI